MAAFEDLKDKLQDQISELRSKIEESPVYHSARERYENLSPRAQRGLLLGLVITGAIFFCYIPYSYFSSSSTYVAEFNEKRSLIRQLLRASRLAMQAGSVSNPPDIVSLQQTISARLEQLSLLPEQNGGVNPVDTASLGGSLAPAGIVQEGLAVTLKQLNLKQVVEIGYNLQNLAQGVRLVGISMLPTQKDTRYFDVVYQIVRYSMPGVGDAGASTDSGTQAPSARRNGGATHNGAATPSRPRFSPPPSSNNSNAISQPALDNNAPPPGEDEQLGDPDEFEGGTDQ